MDIFQYLGQGEGMREKMGFHAWLFVAVVLIRGSLWPCLVKELMRSFISVNSYSCLCFTLWDEVC